MNSKNPDSNNSRVTVVAEAGVNHDGSLDKALSLVDAAIHVGADVVKFQMFSATELAGDGAVLADYQARNDTRFKSQKEMLSSLELTESDFARIADHCSAVGIEFLATAFDRRSLKVLEQIGIRRVKIPSGEITNLDLLEAASSLNLPVILSTGMANLEEVREAVDSLGNNPDLTLLHCVSAYPAPLSDINLKAMDALRHEFRCRVGYSDHTLGIFVAVAAVARGAEVIEKHLTLDQNATGPDHSASLEPPEFAQMVAMIRETEIVLGDGVKRCMPSEMNTRSIARRGLTARTFIEAGEVIVREMLDVKRPATPTSPMRIKAIVGTRASRRYSPGDELEE